MFFGGLRIIWLCMFLVIMAAILFTIIQGLKQWNKNNNSPRLTVPAEVVAKRNSIRWHRHSGGGSGHMGHTTTYTSYYVTFQVESGDRMELMMSGGEYGLLIEGDTGNLTFQGTRYLGFERR